MAKKQSFGEKIRKQKEERRQMVKIVAAEKKTNGQYRFREKIVHIDDLQTELNAARA